MKKFVFLLATVVLSACATQPSAENNTAAHYNTQLGLGYLAQGDHLRAKEKLVRATEQASDTTEPYLALAYYYEQVGQLEAAHQIYQQALQRNSKDGQVNNNYGAFLCAQGEYEQAIVYFERAIQDLYYSHTARAYENAAICYAKLGDFTQADRYADLTLQQDPSRSLILEKLALLKQENNA